MPSRLTCAGAVAALSLALLTSACTSSAPGTGTKGYIAGNGAVTVIDVADRQLAPRLEGKALDGSAITLAGTAGRMVVINIWAAWCGPCRAEADDLVEATKQLPEVAFFGVDIRDDRAAAQAFVRSNDIPYDSLYDPSSSSLLAFHDIVTITSPPTTLVLDGEGRVAAVVSGELTVTTLVGLVDDVAAGA